MKIATNAELEKFVIRVSADLMRDSQKFSRRGASPQRSVAMHVSDRVAGRIIRRQRKFGDSCPRSELRGELMFLVLATAAFSSACYGGGDTGAGVRWLDVSEQAILLLDEISQDDEA